MIKEKNKNDIQYEALSKENENKSKNKNKIEKKDKDKDKDNYINYIKNSSNINISNSFHTPNKLDILNKQVIKKECLNQPPWEHFSRGEKRNRLNYHAYCKYCLLKSSPNGRLDKIKSIRNIPSIMIKHLDTCKHIPSELMKDLKNMTKRKDTETFIKNHFLTLSTAEVTLFQSQSMPLLENMSMDTPNTKKRKSDIKLEKTKQDTSIKPHPVGFQSKISLPEDKNNITDIILSSSESEIDNFTLNSLIFKATITAKLPFTWVNDKTIKKLFSLIQPNLKLPTIERITDPNFYRNVSSGIAGKQLDKMKQDANGVTLSINRWESLRNQNMYSFNLINSSGEICAISIIDIGPTFNLEKKRNCNYFCYHDDKLSVIDEESYELHIHSVEKKIEEILYQLKDAEIQVSGIVVDSVEAYISAKNIASSLNSEKNKNHVDSLPASQGLIVMPCFMHQLNLIIGSVITSDLFNNFVEDMIEMASLFQNPSILETLRAHSNDLDAHIMQPNRTSVYSFLHCLSSLKKFEHSIRTMSSLDIMRIRCTSSQSDQDFFWYQLNQIHSFLCPIQDTIQDIFYQDRKIIDKKDLTKDKTSITLAHVAYFLMKIYKQYNQVAKEYSENYKERKFYNTRGQKHQKGKKQILVDKLKQILESLWTTYDIPLSIISFILHNGISKCESIEKSVDQVKWLDLCKNIKWYYQKWFGYNENINMVELESDYLKYDKSNYFRKNDSMSCDYDVMSFYSSLSGTHPNISKFCCRMYGLSVVSAPIQDVLPEVGYIPTKSRSSKVPEHVLSILQIGFASFQSVHELRKESLKNYFTPSLLILNQENKLQSISEKSISSSFLETIGDSESWSTIWDPEEWKFIRNLWRCYLKKEIFEDTNIGYLNTKQKIHSLESLGSSEPENEIYIHRNMDVPLKDFITNYCPNSMVNKCGICFLEK